MPADFNNKPSLKGNASTEQDPLSLSEIEKLIQLHDPEFMDQISDLVDGQSDLKASDELTQDSFKIDLSSHFSELSKSWKNYIKSFLPFMDLLFEIIDELKNRIKIFKASTQVYLKSIYTFYLPQFIDRITGRFKVVPDQIKSSLQNFGRWPFKKRASLIALLVATMGIVILIQKILSSGIIPSAPPMFIHSFEEKADEIYQYDANDKFEPFYESNRSTKNLVLIPKLLTNIKPSKGSGSNPMAAVEVFVEGSSSEAMVEIKDREPEFRDQFSRLMEDMTFSELSTPEGKRALTDMFKKSANSILTTGTVHRVFIKTIILKP